MTYLKADFILEKKIPEYLNSLGFKKVFETDNDYSVRVPVFNAFGETPYSVLSEDHRMQGDVVIVPALIVDFWGSVFHIYEGAEREWSEHILEIGGSGDVITPGAWNTPERERILHTALKTLYHAGIGSYVVPKDDKYFLFKHDG